MKVRYKLFIIVAIALLGVIVVGGIGIFNSFEDEKTMLDVRDLRIPKIREFEELDTVESDLVRRSYEILSKKELPFEQQVVELKRVHGPLGRLMKEVPDLMQHINARPFNGEGKAVWDRFSSLWGPWFDHDKQAYAALDKALAAPSKEAIDALYDLVKQGNYDRRDMTPAIEDALGKLSEINDKLSADAIQSSLDSSHQAMWVQIGVAVAVLIALSLFAWNTISSIVRPLGRLEDMLCRVADERDLTQRADYESRDEFGQISNAFDRTFDSLRNAFRHIQEQIGNVAQSVEALASTAKEVATSSQSQSSSSSSMAASMEEMAVSINTVSASANDAQALSQKAGEISDEGGEIVERTSNEMGVIAQSVGEASTVIQALGEASKEISNVVQVIREVADQTNLLALNAAIEAARAGEQGRGFAVVADEVRKLAERTAQSTGDISTMIGKIQASATNAVEQMQKVVDQVESGQSLAQEAGKRIRAISKEAGKVSDAMTEISNALKEQGEASNDIAKQVESIAQITDENNAAAEETAANARQLDTLAKNVQNTISQFKV